VRVVRRDNGAKVDIPVANLVEEVKVLLDEIQANLLKTAKEKRDACIEVIHTWDEFTTALNNKRLILAPWCDEEVLDLFYIYCLSDLPSVMNQFFETLVTTLLPCLKKEVRVCSCFLGNSVPIILHHCHHVLVFGFMAYLLEI